MRDREMRRQNAAKKSMSKEADRLTDLIGGLRTSLLGLDSQRSGDRLSNAELGILDERRNNLMLTIAALEDRLSAMQGLIDRKRPHPIGLH